MRVTHRRGVLAALLCGIVVAFVSSGCEEEGRRFGTGPVDLSKWTAINYDYPPNNQPFANWVLSEDQTSVTQTVNADPSIFLSDRELADTAISGTWLVDANDDDDLIGFVFAYQNPGQFYLFDWKSRTQEDANVGHAEQGMSVKIVNVPYAGPLSGNLEPGKPFNEKEMWNTQGSPGKVTLLDHEPTEGWQYKKPYHFQLDFHPGNFRIVVKDGERVIYDKTFHDATYTSGRFGFYNFSQAGVVYKGFETTELPAERSYRWAVTFSVLFFVIVILSAIIAIISPLGYGLLIILPLAVFVLFILSVIIIIVSELSYGLVIILPVVIPALLILSVIVVILSRKRSQREGESKKAE